MLVNDIYISNKVIDRPKLLRVAQLAHLLVAKRGRLATQNRRGALAYSGSLRPDDQPARPEVRRRGGLQDGVIERIIAVNARGAVS